jgi:DNA-binding response OmpR family regulator
LKPKSVLIIDDNCKFLTDSVDYFSTEMGISLVTWAITPYQAANNFVKFNPDLVILDLGMNTLKGQELTIWFKNQVNAPKVMITSICDNEDYRNFAKEMGADGFMKKVNYRAAYTQLIKYLNQDLEKINRDYNYLLN